MIRKDIKTVLSQKEQQTDECKVKIINQNKEDLQLKIQKVGKQVTSLNLDIKYLLVERILKENVQKILTKERKSLQNCFLFKKSQNLKQDNESKEDQLRQISKQASNPKNRFRDVNERIIHYIQHIQAIKQRQSNQYSTQTNSQYSNNQSSQKLQCQSLHIKQIFNTENSLSHQVKLSKLKQKLSLLYQKVKINLEIQEPYLHQKIIERIKRQAQKQSRLKLLTETQQMIRQNSRWMNHQTNRMSNQLQQKEIQYICVNNLGLMKKIMSKKVNNNDFIFENYSKIHEKDSNAVVKTFPVSKVSEKFNEVLKNLQQNKISEQLKMFTSEGQSQKKGIKNSLKQILQDSVYISLFEKQYATCKELDDEQLGLLDRLKQITEKIDGLSKG